MKELNQDLISIIVPAYNAEKYLNRCIDSLVNQTYANIEIIIVDDGSKDNTPEMCKQWAQKDSRIKVIHKENQGLGLARNTGLVNASGKYVSFLDSDDFVDLEMYEKMYEQLRQKQADTCYCSLDIYSNTENKVIKNNTNIRTGVFDGKEVLLDIIGADPKYPSDCVREMSVCASILSNELIKNNGLEFVSERDYICEDFIFDIHYLSRSKKTVVISDGFYKYCVNEGSLTHRYFPKRLEKEKKVYEKACEDLRIIFSEDEYLTRYNRLFLGRIRNCIIQEVKYSHLDKKTIKHNIKAIVSDRLVHKVILEYPIHKCVIKQKIFNYAMKYKWISILYYLVVMKDQFE